MAPTHQGQQLLHDFGLGSLFVTNQVKNYQEYHENTLFF